MSQQARKVVVTGGAGFIGSHLVDRLLAERGADLVVVIDNLTRGRTSNLMAHRDDARLQLIEGDVRNAQLLDEIVSGASVVYHLAAQSSVMGAVHDGNYTFTTNVVGTYNVLRAAADHGVERVVFTSSREVYGEPIDLPVDEESPLLAINSYGASKVAGEVYCRAFRREFGLRTIILRLANVYGPRDVGRVIPLWVRCASNAQDLQVYGGKQVIDFAWVGQAVDALLRATSSDHVLPPINVGSGTGTRIVDLARRINRLAERHARVTLHPARPMEVTRFIARVDRMRELLKIEPPLDPLANLHHLFPAPVGALQYVDAR